MYVVILNSYRNTVLKYKADFFFFKDCGVVVFFIIISDLNLIFKYKILLLVFLPVIHLFLKRKRTLF